MQDLVNHGEDLNFCSESGGSHRRFLSRGTGPDSGALRCPLVAVRGADWECGQEPGNQVDDCTGHAKGMVGAGPDWGPRR